ncbi:hypothetical protein L873DRAFT_172090 [Choiromyces venosus 120613-1]|uniref:Transglutaminase-like domain-containing protein n=1 Tax=Choiromyces venosus 120613-1 TaxID=1336337 RepID=A0A3N4KC58_9PEZI|nr:hypothetical protein L873DRAFT_172090 [Choiromyces venosus 120613-1]
MGRLRRNKQVGLFPSNFVEVLDDPIPPSRPVSRNGASSPAPHGGSISRAASPAPSMYSRAASPQPPMHQYLDRGRSPSPNPYQHQQSYSRAASPNPYTRAASPNPYRAVSPNPYQQQQHSRAPSPNPYQRAASPNPYRAVSPAPGSYNSRAPPSNYQRAASPNPYMGHDHAQDDVPPPAPPPHRYQRASSPLPPQDGRRTPAADRAHSPGLLGNTPSPLRNAMEDVMESLEHMANHDERPRTPHHDPWSPEAFADQFHPSPRRRSYIRPETSLGIGDRNGYIDDDEEEGRGGIPYPDKPRRPASRVEDRTRRFQSSDRYGGGDDVPPAPPPKNPAYTETIRPRTGDASVRNRKSMYDVGSKSPSPNKLARPRPLSRSTTIKSTTTSHQSASTNATTSTAATSASIMSGISASGFSATSAGSLARRKLKAMSVIEGHGQRFSLSNFGRAETPSPSPGIGPANGGAPNALRRGQTWAASETVPFNDTGVFGGLTAPKPKKTGFLKKILNSAKTSTASARSVAHSPTSFSTPKTIPDGINSIAGGKAIPQQQSQDWVQVRRDVNRSNTFSRNERIERQEKQQLMDQVVLRPVDALDDDVDGDEAADGGIVQRPADFDGANLSLVDKSARFIGNPPPFTTPESLANHHVCRPYRSDVQRLRAIFTWVSEKIAWEHPSGPLNGEMGDELDTRTVIAQKRGSPEEVAALVLGMCNAVGITCETVRGYLKAPGEVLDVDMCPRPNHWWNAVVVDGEWRFMDCSLASPTHPRRVMYSPSPLGQADFFWFLTKPSQFCWTHIPIMMEQQHIVPALPMPYLLALPCACPPFFKHGLQMINFDTSLTRIEDLEVAQVEFSVPVDIECFAEVEVRGFATDQDGDIYDTGGVVKKRALCQVAWENGIKTYRVKAVLPGDEGQGVLKIYAGKRGLIHSVKDNPHPLAFALPIIHTGENPPYDFLVRHPTPHAQRHDLYVSQPQCSKLAVNNTFVFAVRQHPSDGPPDSSLANAASSNAPKPAKLAIQTPSGKILRLMKKADAMGADNGMVWETIIKCGERGSWRALVLADRSARWCVYAEWNVV